MFQIKRIGFGYALALNLWTGVGSVAAPLSTAFTYQGQLKQGGVPVNGLFDFEFRLFDLSAGGAQQGGMIPKNDLLVEEGLLKLDLDFGNVFDGNRRWLEVRVRNGASTGAFTPLTPRQELTLTPYALTAVSALSVLGVDGHSLDAPDGNPIDAVIVDNDGDVGIGAVPAAGEKLHVTGDARFDGPNGIGVRNPNNLSAVVRLSWLNDVPRIRWGGTNPGGANGFDFQKIGEVSLLRILDNGNVGIGTATPLSRLHVFRGASGATPLSTRSLTLEDDTDHFLQLLAPDANTTGIVFGNLTNGTAAAGIHFNSEVANGLSFRTDSNDVQMVIDASGNLGLGTTTPVYDLHVLDSSGTARIRVESATGQAGVSFLSDSTGENVVYSPAGTDDLRFYVNGADRMAVTSAGEVGVGTNAPTEKLTVSGNIHVTGEVRRPATGTANMLPLCYGHVLDAGTIASGSGNYSVTHEQGSGRYDISVPGENFGVGATGYAVLVTIMNDDNGTVPSTSTFGGNLVIIMRDPADGSETGAREFSFLIFKP